MLFLSHARLFMREFYAIQVKQTKNRNGHRMSIHIGFYQINPTSDTVSHCTRGYSSTVTVGEQCMSTAVRSTRQNKC